MPNRAMGVKCWGAPSTLTTSLLPMPLLKLHLSSTLAFILIANTHMYSFVTTSWTVCPQSDKHTNLWKYLKCLLWLFSLRYMSSGPHFCKMTHTQTEELKTTPAVADAAGNYRPPLGQIGPGWSTSQCFICFLPGKMSEKDSSKTSADLIMLQLYLSEVVTINTTSKQKLLSPSASVRSLNQTVCTFSGLLDSSVGHFVKHCGYFPASVCSDGKKNGCGSDSGWATWVTSDWNEVFVVPVYTPFSSDIFRWGTDIDLVYFLFPHRYKHFLQDLAANTSPDNPEFQQLSSKCLFSSCCFLNNSFPAFQWKHLQINPECFYTINAHSNLHMSEAEVDVAVTSSSSNLSGLSATAT